MIQIEGLDAIAKGRYELRLSDGSCWRLYTSDLRRYHLREGEELSEEQRDEIYHKCIRIRARKKVLALLERMDRTEKDIRFRLQRAGYDEETVDDAVSYARSFHYIDDERYARVYVRAKSATKSKRQMEAELRRKGIESRELDYLYEEMGEETETEAIRRLIHRKTEVPQELSYEERQKLAASLYRKGFPMELIRSELYL